MPKFSYIASSLKGEAIKGVLQATSKSEVAKKLSTKGLFLVSCRMEETVLEPPVVQSDPSTSNGASPLADFAIGKTSVYKFWEKLSKARSSSDASGKPRGNVSLKELVVLTRQLSISIN